MINNTEGSPILDLLQYEEKDGEYELVKKSIPTLDKIKELCGDDEICIRYNEVYAQVLNDTEYASQFTVIDVTNDKSQNGGKKQRTKRSLQCPTFNPASTSVEQRSLSPWTYVIHQDRNRRPSTILQAKCLCYGCYDMDSPTLAENINLVSTPIRYSVRLPKRINGVWVRRPYNIQRGCQCQVPLYM
uniref:Interleukin 17-3 n=1 Tax=Ciona intestinalis TaxID=7719 RepID=Q6L5M4_CIOIN|nr:interleukin 17-3 [Ciona intestinalis]BAD22762.1 Interleukin 17-3 [Ciona intestinalis]|eukprot:NP_001123348.1 interleukin 17-3 [Ciona intestinalis]